MEPFPSPPQPTQQEVIAENNILRQLFFFMPPLVLAGVIAIGLLIAICIALNFNPMNWLE